MHQGFLSHIIRLIVISMGLIMLGWLIIVPISITRLFDKTLSTKENIMRWNNQGVVLTDRNGLPFFTLYRNHPATFVPLAKVSPNLQQAVINMEDRDFYAHQGFSFRAIGRSILSNVEQGNLSYGGSTITQQLAKNTLLSPTKSFWRKYEELIIAWELEHRYSKNEILEMYLNSVYFGQGAFGAESAAQTYFNKHASELSISEASFLTGLLPSPSYLSSHTDEALVRQQRVIHTLYSNKVISEQDFKNTLHEQLFFQTAPEDINTVAPHFALMVKQQLLSQFDEDTLARSGWQVRTTLDLAMQRYAEQAVAQHVNDLHRNKVSNGAAIVINPRNGEVLALVGSVGWNTADFGKLNMAISPRQTGSAFKPVVYATAFEQHSITPATVLHDVPTTFGKNYRPVDYDGHWRGNVVARRALALSLNIPAVEVANRIGIPAVIQTAQQLGISTLSLENSNYLSTALGAKEISLSELTSAYGAFANAGTWVEPVNILEISDKQSHSVATPASRSHVAVSPETAYLISSILSDNKARAQVFGKALTISKPAAVKTGTTNNYRDAWTVGYTPDVAIGVWVGNNDNRAMDRIAGALGAAPIWRDLMEHFLIDSSPAEFVKPAGIESVRVCGIDEVFTAGTQPLRQNCAVNKPSPSAQPSPTPVPPKARPAVVPPHAD